MEVKILNHKSSTVEEFLSQVNGAALCYTYQWTEMVARLFNHSAFYLVAYEGADVLGVLPLVQTKSSFFGNRMISQAFSNYGGPLAVLPEAKEALFHYAVKIAAEHNCDSIEFRNVNPLPFNLFLRTDKVNMHLCLTADPENLWKGLSSTVRNQVRKAEKSGIIATSGGVEFLDEFYCIYAARMRQLGTPSYSKRLMRGILETFPEQSRIFITKYNGLAVGAGFTIRFGGFVEIPWAATLLEYNSLCPNNLLYWSIIKHYCLSGATCFDFGRCTVNSGTYKFKKQWGAEQVNMHFQYWVRAGQKFSITGPDNPKYKMKIEIWKKLPLFFTNLIGPIISKNLP